MTASERIRQARQRTQTTSEMRESGEKCDGSAKVGDRVSYEDMANPRRFGTVMQIHNSRWGRDYLIRWDETNAPSVVETWSDLRQNGWRFA